MSLKTNLDMTILNPVTGNNDWKKTSGGWECVKRYVTGINSLTENPELLPEIGDEIDSPDGLEAVALKGVNMKNKNNSYWIITMTYAAPEKVALGAIERSDGVPEYSVDDNTMEKPIEQHPGYCTCWNYAFLVKNGISDYPEWETTVTSTEMSEDDAKKYKWQKEDQPVPDGWYKLSRAKDPAIENYLVPAPIINETVYFKSLNQLLNKADFTTARIATPLASDGKKLATKIGGEFLITSLNVRWDGEWWAINRSYQNADEWKDHIYK